MELMGGVDIIFKFYLCVCFSSVFLFVVFCVGVVVVCSPPPNKQTNKQEKKTCKGNFTIKPPSGMKIEYFSQCQTNTFPLLFLQPSRYFSQTAFPILDNFSGKNISLRTFIWF